MSKRKPKKSRKKSKPSRKRREAKVQQKSVREVQTEKRSQRLRLKVGEQRSRLTQWYLSKSMVARVTLGLVIIPLLIALFLLQGIILPFVAAAFAIFITISKVALVWLKGGAFIVYISYKVFKALLGVYYCVSRTLSGWKADRLRHQQARLPMVKEAEYPALAIEGLEAESIELNASWKTLSVKTDETEHKLLFSYLRYFIIGQLFMYQSFWKDRVAYLTLWREVSRQRVKEIFAYIGQTIFTPHLLGAHINSKRLLIPGDSRLVNMSPSVSRSDQIEYTFEVVWKEWSFSKQWPFLHACSESTQWSVAVDASLDSTSMDKIGYVLRTIDRGLDGAEE